MFDKIVPALMARRAEKGLWPPLCLFAKKIKRCPVMDFSPFSTADLTNESTCTIQKCNSVRVVFAKFGFGMFNQVAKQLKNRILELKAIDFRLKCQRHTADN